MELPIVANQPSKKINRRRRVNVRQKVRIVDTVIVLRSERESQSGFGGQEEYIVFDGSVIGRTVEL